MSAANTVLSVRVTASERDLLETAASQGHTNLSDFIRRHALQAAELDVLGQRQVVIAAEHWAEFEAWANQPARTVPALQALATAKLAWQD